MLQQLDTLRKKLRMGDAHQKEQSKRYLLDFLAGLVWWFLRGSHPWIAVLIPLAMVFLPINPNHWDARDKHGEIDLRYLGMRFMFLFGTSMFFYMLIMGGPPTK